MNDLATPEAKFLEKLFFNLNSSGLNYAVMRNYDMLPLSACGSDLDVVIDPSEAKDTIGCILKSIKEADGIPIGRVDTTGLTKIFALGAPDDEDDQWWGVRLDICKGVIYEGSHNLVNKKIWIEHIENHNGVKVLSKDLAAVLGVMKEVLHNGHVGNKYIAHASDVASNRWNSVASVISPIGDSALAALFDICINTEDGDSIVKESKRIRRNIEKMSLSDSPETYLIKKIQYYGSRIRRMIWPPGKMIAILGTDGAGKSAVIEAISPSLNDATHKALKVMHLRPTLFPPLGKIKGGKSDAQGVVADPHGQAPSGFLMSLVRLVYYFMDYTIGYWTLVRPIISKSPSIVLFDRYAYDILIDPARLRIDLPQWILRIFVRTIPAPHLIIGLYGDPEILANRKKELPVSEVRRQVKALKKLLTKTKNAVLVSTEVPITETRNRILNSIKNVC